MTNSKRKRFALGVRSMDLGPYFYENFKHGFFNQFVTLLEVQSRNMGLLHDGVTGLNLSDNKVSSSLHVQIDRSELIEGMNLLDSYVGIALFHYQLRKLEIEEDEIKAYSKVDDGINECLRNQNIPKELEKSRSTIKNFRRLRNQFAHFNYGQFFFSAKEESFESFLSRLGGIKLQESYHCVIDGKAGVMLPYQIITSEFLMQFYKEAQFFYATLLEFMFPTEAFVLYDFQKNKWC